MFCTPNPKYYLRTMSFSYEHFHSLSQCMISMKEQKSCVRMKIYQLKNVLIRFVSADRTEIDSLEIKKSQR